MTDHIKFAQGTYRNTKAYTLRIGPYLSLWISYNTIVAASVRYPDSWERNECARWGISRTTNKHLREMGVSGFPDGTEGQIDAIVASGLRLAGLELIGPTWRDAACQG